MKVNLAQLKELVDGLAEEFEGRDMEIEIIAQPNYPMVVELATEYAVLDNKIQILLTGHKDYASVGDAVEWPL